VHVLFHVQHLLGIGHVRRATTLVHAMRAAGLRVTVLSGGEPVAGIDFAAEVVQLPSARATDATFRTLVDARGRPLDDMFHAARRRLVADTVAAARPDVVLIESYPFGRRAFRHEYEPLFSAGVPVAVSLRDVLVAKDAKRTAEAVAIVRERISLVLVHGDERFLPLGASFPGAGEIAEKLAYTGYVYEAAPTAGQDGRGEVIVSAGGGAVGERLLRAALAARPLSRLADTTWRLIAGPNLSKEARQSISDALPAAGVTLERFRPDFPSLLRNCAVSVSQAGYNTFLDILHARPAAVLVPFAAEGETEQILRARRLGALGGVRVVEESALSGGTLAAAVDAAGPPALQVAMDGGPKAAEIINHMFKKRS
jgi:predicted glycosyltransferase